MINNRLIIVSLCLSALLSLLLTLYPALDLGFSELFYKDKEGFIYYNNPFVQYLYLSIPLLTKAFVLVAILYVIWRAILYKDLKKLLASAIVYIIVSALFAPGFVVNFVLKENVGRARPSQITDFGGSLYFSPAFKVSRECEKNCSFSSGHAAMAFYFTAIAYAYALRSINHIQEKKNPRLFTWLYSGALFFGILVGLSRIIMGGHFLSDVAFSCFVVLLINHMLYLCWTRLKLTV